MDTPLFVARKGGTMLKEVLAACLGDYDHIGFKLSELDDHLLELSFMGRRVALFSSTGATVAAVRQACQEYLREHEFSNKD